MAISCSAGAREDGGASMVAPTRRHISSGRSPADHPPSVRAGDRVGPFRLPPEAPLIDGLDIDRARTALILVDIQYDFLPGGALAVEEGDRILEPVRRLMEADPFGLYVATQDWHPRGHVSFASTHAGRAPFDRIAVHGHE